MSERLFSATGTLMVRLAHPHRNAERIRCGWVTEVWPGTGGRIASGLRRGQPRISTPVQRVSSDLGRKLSFVLGNDGLRSIENGVSVGDGGVLFVSRIVAVGPVPL